LLREEAEHAAEEAALREEADEDDHDGDDEHDHDGDFELVEHADDGAEEGGEDGESEGGEGEEGETAEGGEGNGGRRRRGRGRKGNDDQVEALRQRRMSLRRRYKIQDVIRRRQVLLVQVVKEER